MEKYKWQGENVKVKFGLVRIKQNLNKPLFWYNYEASKTGVALISAVQIELKNEGVFCISNEFGIGVHKLLNGGYPDFMHFSFMDDYEFIEHSEYKVFNGAFDLIGHEESEKERKSWRKENFPEEFNKWEEMKKTFRIQQPRF